MLTGLPVLGDTSFKFTNTGSNNQNSTVSLRCACNHVFDKVSVSWGTNSSHTVFAGLKFLQEMPIVIITLAFSFQLVQDQGRVKGAHEELPFQTFWWFSSQFLHICRSGSRWWWTCPILLFNGVSVDMSLPFPFWLFISRCFHTCVMGQTHCKKKKKSLFANHLLCDYLLCSNNPVILVYYY